MIIKKDGLDAYQEYRDNLPKRRWANAKNPSLEDLARSRLNEDVFRPLIETDFKLQGSSFFTMGSCFAREVETALTKFDQTVLSKVQPGSPISFRRGGYTNRYNTASMVNELEFALGIKEFNPASIVCVGGEEDKYQDLHSHPAGGYCTFEKAMERREALQSLFGKIREADVFVCTLGLTEVWFDRETGEYTNVSPTNLGLEEHYPDRFEFQVLDYNDNMKNLERIYEIVRTHLKPELKIVVTVSPVPLLATFSGRDVVQANTFSKSTLRSCAESWVQMHKGEIDYFPSYEMAMNSNRDVVWQSDLIHVTKPFVREIMRTFLLNFGCVDDPKALEQTQADRSELMLMKADSHEARGDVRSALLILEKMYEAGRKIKEVRLRLLRIQAGRGKIGVVRKLFAELSGVFRPKIIKEVAGPALKAGMAAGDHAFVADVLVWLSEKKLENWQFVREAAKFTVADAAAFARVQPLLAETYSDKTDVLEKWQRDQKAA